MSEIDIDLLHKNETQAHPFLAWHLDNENNYGHSEISKKNYYDILIRKNKNNVVS